VSNRINDGALLIGRVAIAALFLPAGIGKLSDLSGFAGSLANKGLPFADVLAVLAVGAEIGGAAALILGFMPRLTSLLLVAFTVVATLTTHAFWAFPEAAQQAQQTHFFKNVAIIGGLLFYFVSGPGGYSIPMPSIRRAGVTNWLSTRGS